MINRLLILVLLASQGLSAQADKSTQCVLAMNVPIRLMAISADEKEVVYRDKKTDAIRTFTKAGVTDYDFNLKFTADQIFEELANDPSYVDQSMNLKKLRVADCYVIDWTFSEDGPNRRNNRNLLAIMDICGQYYTFEFRSPKTSIRKTTEIEAETVKAVIRSNGTRGSAGATGILGIIYK